MTERTEITEQDQHGDAETREHQIVLFGLNGSPAKPEIRSNPSSIVPCLRVSVVGACPVFSVSSVDANND